MSHSTKPKQLKYYISSAIFGLIATFASYIDFGSGDQIEQLPLVYRCIDPEYLVNDFFVNAGQHSMARLFFAKLMAVVSGSEANLPTVFFITTALVNIAISIITYRFAKKLFSGSSASGLFAAAATMFVSTFSLGWNATIYHSTLIPAAMATPLLFGAIWAVAEKRFITAAVLCIAGSVLHPLMGLEMSAIVFFSGIVQLLLNKELSRKYVIRAVAGILAVFVFAVLILYGEFKDRGPDAETFIYILAYFRHPHHYLPSRFGAEDYWMAMVFLLSVTVVFFWGIARNRDYDKVIAAIIISIILLCIGGYVFVEVFPSKLWTIAQTFRLLYFVKWLGLILIAGNIPHYKAKGGVKLLYLFSLMHPFTTGWAIISRTVLSRGKTLMNPLIIDEIVFTVLFWWIWWMGIEVRFIHILSILLCIAITERYYLRIIIRILIPAVLVSGVFLIVTRHTYQFSRNAVNVIAGKVFKVKYNFVYRPGYDLYNSEILTYVKMHTDKDAVFLTPPRWGQFRLAAKRAIVVDFKAFPFSGDAMEEWYKRIITCYGKPQYTGFGMVGELYEYYDAIDDAQLKELKQSYGCSYAILEDFTSTDLEVLCSDKGYKLVYIP